LFFLLPSHHGEKFITKPCPRQDVQQEVYRAAK
jgi:hypothetical protein